MRTKFLIVRAEGYGQGEGTMYMVLDQSQRHHDEIMFSLMQMQMITYRNIDRYMYTYS